MKTGLSGITFFSLFMLAVSGQCFSYEWEPQPEKAALMIVFAHPDDEGQWFGGVIPYYAACRSLPVIAVCMTNNGTGTRAEEMHCAAEKYGLPNEPVFAGFNDCCYGSDLQCCWDCWGGKDKAVAYLTGLVRKYKPDVLVCHDFSGEYGHPNHMGCGIAFAETFSTAPDASKFPEQLDTVEVWQPKKCYVHLLKKNTVTHSWNMTCDGLGGRSVKDVTNEALDCHQSQGGYPTRFLKDNSVYWGLYATTVGLDKIGKDDFFENVDTEVYKQSVYAANNMQNAQKKQIAFHPKSMVLRYCGFEKSLPRLSIFSMSGGQSFSFSRQETRLSGTSACQWDLSLLPSGLYIYRARISDMHDIKGIISIQR